MILEDMKIGEYGYLSGGTLFRVHDSQVSVNFADASYINIVLYPGTVQASIRPFHPATTVFEAPEWNKA